MTQCYIIKSIQKRVAGRRKKLNAQFLRHIIIRAQRGVEHQYVFFAFGGLYICYFVGLSERVVDVGQTMYAHFAKRQHFVFLLVNGINVRQRLKGFENRGSVGIFWCGMIAGNQYKRNTQHTHAAQLFQSKSDGAVAWRRTMKKITGVQYQIGALFYNAVNDEAKSIVKILLTRIDTFFCDFVVIMIPQVSIRKMQNIHLLLNFFLQNFISALLPQHQLLHK